MSEVNLVINGCDITAEEGVTILEAARAAGIDIPTLCSHEDLAPFGACRLCTVEIAKEGRSRLVASCEGRKVILEMLLARSPGVQVLRDYGRRYGVDVSKFSVDPSFCILCGLCVNYCAEVKGKHAIGFTGRGVERHVMFLPEMASQECTNCWECFSICPTGVLPSNYGLARVPHFTWPANPFE